MTNHQAESLCELIESYAPDAVMAFWAGSLTQNNMAISSSDYDVVVITPQINAPVSYNRLVNPLDNRKVDLILRSPETLAFELMEARYSHKSTVPRSIAEGRVILDRTGKAPFLQQEMKNFIANGPDAMSVYAYRDNTSEITRDLHMAHIGSKEAKYLFSFQLTHDMATLYLKSKREWLASGKILGRYLEPHHEYKNALEQAYEKDRLNAFYTHTPLQNVILCDSADDIAFEHAVEEQDTWLHDQFMMRYSNQYLCEVMRQGTIAQKKMATDFMGNKLYSVTEAMNSERFGRLSNEYFFALSRIVFTMATIHEAATGVIHDMRYQSLTEHYSALEGIVRQAEKNKPEKLREFANDIAFGLNSACDQSSIRYSPTTFRCDANEIKGLIL